MKKYITLAAVVAMMASCANEVLIEDVTTEEQEITFANYTDLQTKAETAENSGMDATTALNTHHETFKVWGAKKTGSTYSAVYAAATPGTVTYSSTKWTAAPAKFWDKAASNYYFYAAAPASQSWGLTFASASDMSDATITLSNFSLKGVNVTTEASTTAVNTWKGKEDIDLLVANPCVVERKSYNKPVADKVELYYNHILSRLNVLVKKGSNVESSTVKLTTLKVYNMKNKGTFNEKPAGLDATALAAGTIKRWATPVVEGTYTPQAITLDNVTTTAQYVLECLVMPQNVNYQSIDVAGYSTDDTPLATRDEAYIEIRYTVDDEPFFGYYNLAKAFGATVDDNNTTAKENEIPFNEGWQNNLTITINPSTIEFDGKVFNWKDQLSKEYEIPSETNK